MDKAKDEIISKLPQNLKEALTEISFTNLQEIRLRCQKPAMLYYSDKKEYLKKENTTIISSYEDIQKVVNNFCSNSVYAYTEDIKDGFLTLSGGHRVGIAGRAVGKKSDFFNIVEFSSVNIRIAREYKDFARPYIKHLKKGEKIENTIIIAPPGAGKTTFLRDVARCLSEDVKVSVIDERFEIASQKKGSSQFDVGMQTDVLSGFSKKEGITHALRSLSPDVIVCDEIGTREDVCSIEDILKGGCRIIATMHGYSIDEALSKKEALMSYFDVAILIGRSDGKPEVIKCQRLWE